MARYIDADALHYTRVRIFHGWNEDGTPIVGGYNAVVMSAEIKDATTIEARPMVRGEWLCKPLDDFRMEEAKCSVCGWTGIENYDAYINPFHFDFCPNCGAEMRTREEDNE